MFYQPACTPEIDAAVMFFSGVLAGVCLLALFLACLRRGL